MIVRNWCDVQPKKRYWNTTWVRDMYSRRCSAYGITRYLEFDVLTIEPKGSLPYHKHNMDEVLLVMFGVGSLEANDEKRKVGVHDTIYVPAGMPHGMLNPNLSQPLLVASFGIPVPPEIHQIILERASREEKTRGSFMVINWFEVPPYRGHENSLWWHKTYELDNTPYFHCAGIAVAEYGKPIDYHYHNYEEIYFILQGRGVQTVGGEQKPVTEGDAIWIPSETPHSVVSTLEDQPISIICVGCLVPAATMEDILQGRARSWTKSVSREKPLESVKEE